MPVFHYRAKKVDGTDILGTVEASSDSSAQEALEEKGLFVIALEQKRSDSFFATPIQFFNKIPAREIVIFLRQLAVMMQANVPLVRSLNSLASQISRADFQKIVLDISEEVNSGVKLSNAMSRHKRVFDDFFIHMIRAGETTGKLDDTLTYLADQKEKDYDVLSQVKGALIYPAFIFSGLIIVGMIMMIYVIPKLTNILSSSGQDLPWQTTLLINTSDFFTHFWWIILILLIIVWVVVMGLYRTESGKSQLDLLKLKIPIFGNIYKKIALTRFCRSLSTLLGSGVPLTQSLQIAGDIVGNYYYKELIEKTREEVMGGKSITIVFQKDKNIPPMISQMLKVGEETGRIDQILMKLADFYSREVNILVRNLVSLIEPLVIMLLGGAVVILVMAVLLPMYNLTASF